MEGITVTGHLLGAARFQIDGRPLSLTPAGAMLLAMLLIGPGPVDRRRLAQLVGEDCTADVLRKRINTAMWRLRRHLTATDGRSRPLLTVSGGRWALACDSWSDAAQFAADTDRLTDPRTWTPVQAQRVTRALLLYQGDFLVGLTGEWVVSERERYAELHLAALVRLAQWHRLRGDAHQVIDLASRALAAEPLREESYRLLIRAYVDADLPEMARRQLDRCRRMLRSELGVEPAQETIAAAGTARPIQQIPSQRTGDRAEEVATSLRELERLHGEATELARALTRSLDDLNLRQQWLRQRLLPDQSEPDDQAG